MSSVLPKESAKKSTAEGSMPPQQPIERGEKGLETTASLLDLNQESGDDSLTSIEEPVDDASLKPFVIGPTTSSMNSKVKTQRAEQKIKKPQPGSSSQLREPKDISPSPVLGKGRVQSANNRTKGSVGVKHREPGKALNRSFSRNK